MHTNHDPTPKYNQILLDKSDCVGTIDVWDRKLQQRVTYQLPLTREQMVDLTEYANKLTRDVKNNKKALI